MSLAREKYAAVSVAFANQFQNMRTKLNQEIKNKNTQIEIELKLKNIGSAEFYRILNWLTITFKNGEKSITTDYMTKEGRFTTSDTNNTIIKTIKKSIHHIDDDIWNTRLSLSSEEIVTGIPGDFTKQLKITDLNKFLHEKSDLIREKHRTTFNVNNLYKIDITYVVSKFKTKTDYTESYSRFHCGNHCFSYHF